MLLSVMFNNVTNSSYLHSISPRIVSGSKTAQKPVQNCYFGYLETVDIESCGASLTVSKTL